MSKNRKNNELKLLNTNTCGFTAIANACANCGIIIIGEIITNGHMPGSSLAFSVLSILYLFILFIIAIIRKNPMMSLEKYSMLTTLNIIGCFITLGSLLHLTVIIMDKL